MADLKKKKVIFHIVQWILAVLIAALLINITCFVYGDYAGVDSIRNQFIDATVYSYLIISSFVFIEIFIDDEEIGKTLEYMIAALGGVLYVVTGVLLLVHFIHSNSDANDVYFRIVIALILCLGNGVLYLVEFFFLLIKREALE